MSDPTKFVLPEGEVVAVELVVTKPFAFAHRGIYVQQFEPAAEPQPMTQACADVALAERWARAPRAARQAAAVTGGAPQVQAATDGAPEQASLVDSEASPVGDAATAQAAAD